mgnify:CR=1 FL=1
MIVIIIIIMTDMERYFAWHRALDNAAHDLNLPIITVVYEDLLSNTMPNLERMLQFMYVGFFCFL